MLAWSYCVYSLILNLRRFEMIINSVEKGKDTMKLAFKTPGIASISFNVSREWQYE